jgi:hypothetical protein
VAIVYYSLLRLLLLVSFGGLAYAVGMRGPLLLIAAFVGSGIVSYFALRRPRAQVGDEVGGFFHRMNARIDAAARAEDDDELVEPVEAVDAEPVDPVTPPNTSGDPRTADSPRSS